MGTTIVAGPCRIAALACVLAILPGCGGDSGSDPQGQSGGGGASGGGPSGGAGGMGGGTGGVGAGAGGTGPGGGAGSGGIAGGTGAGASGGQGATGGGTTAIGRCSDTPPEGALEPPAPPAYSGGSCPKLVPGANSIQSAGNDRAFLLVTPTDPKPGERLPLVFLWHWLKGKAQDFVDKAEVQKAVDAQRFLAVVPEQKGDLLFVWPVEVIQPESRIDEELTLFDDLLACIDGQFEIDRSCVSSTGVSAGALWTDQLAHRRSEYLASFMSLSGGVGGFMIKPWGNPARAIPGVVLWGGPDDNCAGLFSFESLSGDLESNLSAGGHFFLECIHNCGHSEPPFTSGTSSKYQGLWDFALDHPYWLTPGTSVYEASGVPPTLPEWCAIGAGKATPRTGQCTEGSKC